MSSKNSLIEEHNPPRPEEADTGFFASETIRCYPLKEERGAPFKTSPSRELKDDTKRRFIEDVLVGAQGEDLNRMFKLASEIKNAPPPKPQWSERKELHPDRKFDPVTWIKEHYGTSARHGEWLSNGLTMADLSRADRKLYDAYVALMRRNKSDPLHLPKTAKPRIIDAEKNVEDRRAKRREAYHLNKK